jgi:hypothetical protein
MLLVVTDLPTPRAAVALLAGLALSLALPAPAADEEPGILSVVAEESAFVVRLSDGSVLRSADLVGAVLHVEGEEDPLAIRIDAVEVDKDSGLVLHTLSVRRATGDFEPWCAPDARGRRVGFPLAGRARSDGTLAEDPERFELVCTSSARGQCVAMGYAPWRRAREGRPLAAAFEACVRMLRADYCGDGATATREGVAVDAFDDLGVRQAAEEPALAFEAGWSEAGAVCVHHARVPAIATVESLAARCPRLAGHTGAACTEAVARDAGALLFSRSRP